MQGSRKHACGKDNTCLGRPTVRARRTWGASNAKLANVGVCHWKKIPRTFAFVALFLFSSARILSKSTPSSPRQTQSHSDKVDQDSDSGFQAQSQENTQYATVSRHYRSNPNCQQRPLSVGTRSAHALVRIDTQTGGRLLANVMCDKIPARNKKVKFIKIGNKDIKNKLTNVRFRFLLK